MCLLRIFAAGLLVVALGGNALAQGTPPKAGAVPRAGAPQPTSSNAPPNALQGFSQNRDKPIQIDAARLEVRDKDRVATFFGDAKADVKVIQGDVTMRSQTLVVFYDQDDGGKAGAGKSGAGKSAKAAAPGPTGSSQIKRLEAKGNVIVTQKDQTVTGDNGVFDMKSNTVTMLGSVVMTQCENVLRGDRLVVDLTTGVSKVDGSRVSGLLMKSPSCGSAQPVPGTSKPAENSAPKGPTPLQGR